MSSFDAGFFASKEPDEVVKTALRSCFANGWAAFVTAASLLVPATALNLGFSYLIGRTGALDSIMSLQGGQVDPTKIDMSELFGNIGVLVGGAVVVGGAWLLSAFAAAAAVGRMMAERALGRTYGPAEAWDFVLGKAFRLIGGGIVLGVVLFVGYIIASIPAGIVAMVVGMATGGVKPGATPSPLMQIIPAIVVLPIVALVATYVVSMPAVVAVEDLGGISAVFRSFRLVSGNFRRAVTAVILGGLITILPVVVVQTVLQQVFMKQLTAALGGGPGMLAVQGPGTILSLLTWPILFTVQAFIYFDLRSRQAEADFTPYELTLEVGGELPEGVQDPVVGSTLVGPASADGSAPSDISRG
jgi:hypothetical protein